MLLPIGKFAKTCCVAASTLRFWEKDGILLPQYVNEENGYRYYDSNQFEHVQAILALQRCGFSNAEIMRCLERSHTLEALSQKLAQLYETRERIDTAILFVRYSIDTFGDNNVIAVKSIPELQYLSVRRIFNGRQEIKDCFTDLGRRIASAGLRSEQPFQVIGLSHQLAFTSTDIDYECLFRVSSQCCAMEGTTLVTVPELRAATTIVRDDTLSGKKRTMRYLWEWAEKNGYTPAPPLREWFIITPFDGEHMEKNFLTELQLPLL